MNKIDELKTQYESIYASDRLKQNVNRILKRKKFPVFLKITAAAAAFILSFTAFFNFFPNFAEAAAEIPVIGTLVRVITFGKYENKDQGYEAKVVTPKIEGLLDKDLEERLNKDFKENAEEIIKAYENDVKELKKEYGEETIHMGVTSDYIIKTDTDRILSLDVYILYTAGSSNTKHTFYTIDKKTGKLLSLSGLFKNGADYISPISEYIKEEMKRLNTEEDGIFWLNPEDEFSECFEKIRKNQNFYINDNSELVICFDKYEVAAGAQGCPEFVIPPDVISSVVSPSSVIYKK